MFNRVNLYGCLLVASVTLVACGNKGELFLTGTPQLPEQLDTARDAIDESVSATRDEAAATKKKTQAAEP